MCNWNNRFNFYSCCVNPPSTGIRLWNKEQLEKNTCSRPQINTDFNVTASDSIKDKSKLLNIEGGLNLSVLGGLVQVSGAAKYLKDTKTSFLQQRLTLHYHSTSQFKELTVNQLPSENIPDDVNDIATHVVTGILYGAMPALCLIDKFLQMRTKQQLKEKSNWL